MGELELTNVGVCTTMINPYH